MRAADLWRIPGTYPRISALVLGLLAATVFQPLGLWPLALAAMGAFAALLVRTGDPKRAAVLGWLFGFAHFTFGNNWIATAFTHQAEMPAVLADAFGISRSEARRLIAQGGVRIDDEVVTDADVAATELDGRVLRAGKRRFVRLRRD